MLLPFDLKRMIDTELLYTERFTNVTEKPYGLLFWNEANKYSNDSNHGIITDFIGVDNSLKDIKRFYRAKGIIPRLYPAYQENELELLTPHLKNHEFNVQTHPNRFFLHTKESKITPVHNIHYQRIKEFTQQLIDFIVKNDLDERTLKVVERHLKHPNYHLLGGFIDEDLITVASVNIFVGYSRVDDVMTHKFYRGKGYSSTLIHYLIQYQKEQSNNHLYLYSSLPGAAKIYEKAGFIPVSHNLTFWTAYKDM